MPEAQDLIRLFPTRLVSSDIVVLGAGEADEFPGRNGGQPRRQIIVSNLSTTLTLYICEATALNHPFLPVFPRSSVTVETNANVRVFNPTSSDVSYVVGELFYDPSNSGRDAYGTSGQAQRVTRVSNFSDWTTEVDENGVERRVPRT